MVIKQEARELNIKPSCLSELLALPKEHYVKILNKIHLLLEDPFPKGDSKKQLKGFENVYRLRVSNFRVFYSFGDGWLKVLKVDRRSKTTYKAGVNAENPVAPKGSQSGDWEEIEEAAHRKTHQDFQLKPNDESKPLPFEITPEWLDKLRVPLKHIPVLVACRTEDALLSVSVPGDIIERIVDQIYKRSIEEVQQQPDLVVNSTQDLIKYKEGTLMSFLLKLDPEQRDITDWALSGPTMVKGGAGTGKSTVALYRVKALLEQPKSSGKETVLFTTYTKALMNASRQLLEQILSKEQMKRVRVATCDEMAHEIVSHFGKIQDMEKGSSPLDALRTARKTFEIPSQSAFEKASRTRSLAVLSERYILEEFNWIIDGRGLKTLEEYLEAPRPGRGHSFRKGLRETIWALHQAFTQTIKAKGITRWSDLRQQALAFIQSGQWKEHYDYVVVDEAQDLSPLALTLMAELAKTPEGLFFAADNKQSLYSRNYSWSTVHPRLQFMGRTRNLKRNYRSTQEIDRAAFSILEHEDADEMEASISSLSGPIPVLLQGAAPEDEALWAMRFIRQMARHLRIQINASAVLVPNKEIGAAMAEALTRRGLPAQYFAGRDLDLESAKVKVLTLHSAKGLEFPIVVVCGLQAGTYPVKADFEDLDVYAERMRNERRTLYVGLSRAMRGLMLICPPDNQHEALNELNSENWHVEQAQ